ncbi:helix-turn-helix domain-containing protein [Enterobacter bugandensis]|uniref:LexA family transcriptional regulator n=1 Tax=Enterobacter bugandensis TaxID=881260 RepID=UPI002002CF79|nr:S24 family peptidase [Enterobacter bugandensis]EKS1202955.1 helix-turn-helix domain-containing protein [Escherichia coli]MCK6810636.1 helix-turn-helix domain-containing protein [Enterobacter bugandensis]
MHIYRRAKRWDDLSMDIKDIRRTNLRYQQNLAIRSGITKADFAEKVGTSPSTLSQILGEKAVRNLGDDLARKIELNLNLPHGWLDQLHPELEEAESRGEAKIIGGIEPWDNQTSLDDDEVEIPFLKEVQLAAGAGSTFREDHNGYKLRFAKSTLRKLNIQFTNAVCVEVIGNSMEPVLPNGSTVGVDTGCKEVKDGKMYAIDYGDLLRVKLLYAMPGGMIRIRSYNSEEHPEEIRPSSDIRVIGRVFWSSVTY